MTRRALLVGNSVTYSELSKSVTPPILKRTINRIRNLLSNLEGEYAFDVTVCLDERGKTVVRKLEDVAKRAADDGDLLLFYYFGHGEVSSDLKLTLLHKGSARGSHDRIGLELLETRVSEENVKKSLFLLDCCYAGGLVRTFPYSLRGNHFRIAATAPSSKAYVLSGTVDDPIGAFTSAFMESFSTPEACVSSTDNSVTAESLFKYIRRSLEADERVRIQTPTRQGSLPDTLFEFQQSPSLRREYAHWADEKTAYAKIVIICRALLETNVDNTLSLHRYLTSKDSKYRRSFQTLFKDDDGTTFRYLPVGHSVVVRYVLFMRRMDLLADDGVRLSPRGKTLGQSWAGRGNELLLDAVDNIWISEG